MDPEMLKKATDAYLESAGGATAERLRFLESLWQIQSAIEAVDRQYATPVHDTAHEALATGQPLFLAAPPVVSLSEYIGAVVRVAAQAADAAGLTAEQAGALRAAPFSEVLTEQALDTAVRDTDAFVTGVAERLGGSESGLTHATLAFVLVSALVPFLTGPAAVAWSVLDESERRVWDSGHCPVCGSAAAMGRMGERTALQGGERRLWCGLCHTEWEYARLRCVRCGTRDPAALRYSYEESDPAHRVHLCDECHGYSKFVFEDETRIPVSMEVEDAVTATLDAIARSQGYSPMGDGAAATGAGL